MSTYKSGSQSQIVIGNEAVFNTIPAIPLGCIMRKSSFSFGSYKSMIKDGELRADPNPPPEESGMQKVVAKLVAPMTTEEFGFIAYWFLGGYSVTGIAAPYAHVFVVDTSAPASLWVEVGDLGTGKYDLFHGLVISSISLGTITKADNMVNVTIMFEASGKNVRNGAAAQDATPYVFAVPKHTMPLVKVGIDDATTALITQTTYSISRTITMMGVLDGTLYFTDFDAGDYSIDCTIAGWREAADTIVGYDDDAEHGVAILCPRPGAPTYFVNIDHNECFIHDSETPGDVSGDGPTIQTVRVNPTFLNHADGSCVVITVATETASYLALQAV